VRVLLQVRQWRRLRRWGGFGQFQRCLKRVSVWVSWERRDLLSIYLDLYFEIWNLGVSRESQYDFGRSWATIRRIVEQGTTSNSCSKLASDALLSQRKDPALATLLSMVLT
jgi:hypothetical protein